MTDEHPFKAVYMLAEAGGFPGIEYREIEEPRGLYVRLIVQSPPLIFKRAMDHGTNIDRVAMPYHDRIDIKEDVFLAGPEAVLSLIRTTVAERSARQR